MGYILKRWKTRDEKEGNLKEKEYKNDHFSFFTKLKTCILSLKMVYLS